MPDPFPAERGGCCASWPKPCSYHEGRMDALDSVEAAGSVVVDADIIHAMFLLLPWAERGQLRHMLTQSQRDALRDAIICEDGLCEDGIELNWPVQE